MRKYTFLLSMVAHLAVIVAVLTTTLVVTDALPGVRRMAAYVMVRAELPPPVAPPPPRPNSPAAGLTPISPIEAADTIAPQPDVAPSFEPGAPDSSSGFAGGGPPGDGVIGDAIPPPPPAEQTPARPVRVGSILTAPTKVKHVAPVYPRIARDSRTSGVVILEAVIAEDGSVRDLRVVRSIPLLDQAAIDAVRQWLFTPTLLNGRPTPVIMTVTVSFNLN